MFTFATNVEELVSDFRMEGTMFRYNSFMPRLYNYCRSLGFEPGKMLPSRAFCSDENQGYPIILITKHFGTFPFNHGRGGAVVATERHGPYAEHGEDLVIIQASHVGYDAGDELLLQARSGERTTAPPRRGRGRRGRRLRQPRRPAPVR